MIGKPEFIINEKVAWEYLIHNPNAIHIIEQNLDKFDWFKLCHLSKNINAIHLLEKNLNKVDWYHLSANPNAIHILEKNLDKVNWYYLSGNPNAIHILEKNLHKVSWDNLSENPNAIHILEKNLDKVNWNRLSSNPNAIHIIKKNLDKFNDDEYEECDDIWCGLSQNKYIMEILGELDYEAMKEQMKPFAEELVKYVFCPKRVQKISEKYQMSFEDILDVY